MKVCKWMDVPKRRRGGILPQMGYVKRGWDKVVRYITPENLRA